MKYVYLIALLFALGSCDTSTENTNNQDEQTSENPKTSNENSNSEMLLGTWKLDYKEVDIIQLITYNSDGTYQMTMGPREVNGTWELTDSLLITKSSPEAEGQKKTIIKLDSKDLWTNWEQQSGTTKELKYVRVEEE